MSKKDSIIIGRMCPQCYHRFDSKAEFLAHLIDDYKHRFSKAAAAREWKKADAEAKTEELQAQIEALGLVQCNGCAAAINPADAALADNDKYSPKYVCKACYRDLPGLGVVICDEGHWAYWYPSDNEYRQNPFHPCGSWYDSAYDAEKRLRSQVAQMRLASNNSNWQECLNLIQDADDRRNFISHVAWHMAYARLGYRPETHNDPRFREFSDTEASIYQELRQAA